MDIRREGVARKKLIRRIIIGVLIAAAIPAVHIALGRLEPAAPTVERSTLWPDKVKRGEMIRNVRGLGTLVPEEILAIPATTDGRVEKKLLLPGTPVKPETVLLVLTNPELMTELVDAEWQVKAAEATYTDLKVRLESEQLDQEAELATVWAQYSQAALEAERDEALFKEGLAVEIKSKISRSISDNLKNRHAIDKKRLEINLESIKAQLSAQKTRIEQLRAMHELKKSQVDALTVRAGTEGVLQEVLVEVGQQVTAGTSLARVVQPWRLKAELRIAETQVKDIMIGQPVEVDTRNGIIRGRVSRIDPAAQNGTFAVDAQLLDELPKSARPALSVEGTIELERLDDVMYVSRPVTGQENSTISLFRIGPDGKEARRVRVKLGRSSVSSIEVLEGLNVGDEVILSDMSQWDNFDRIRLN